LVKEVFKHTVSFAKEEGLLDLSYLATDGSKVKANASNRRVLTKEELEVLLRFVDGELEEWAKQDTIEDNAFGEIRGSDQYHLCSDEYEEDLDTSQGEKRWKS